MTRYGMQPGFALVLREFKSVSEAARRLNVPRKNLDTALQGCNLPHPELADRLGELLNVDKTKLFTPEVLRRRYTGRRRLGL